MNLRISGDTVGTDPTRCRVPPIPLTESDQYYELTALTGNAVSTRNITSTSNVSFNPDQSGTNLRFQPHGDG